MCSVFYSWALNQGSCCDAEAQGDNNADVDTSMYVGKSPWITQNLENILTTFLFALISNHELYSYTGGVLNNSKDTCEVPGSGICTKVQHLM